METEIKQLIEKIEHEYSRLSNAVELIREAESTTTKSTELLKEYKEITNKTECTLTDLQNRLSELETVINELQSKQSLDGNKFKDTERQVNQIRLDRQTLNADFNKINKDLILLQKQMEYIDKTFNTHTANHETLTGMYNDLTNKIDHSNGIIEEQFENIQK